MEAPGRLPKARPPRNIREPRNPRHPAIPPPRFSRRWFLVKFNSWRNQDLAVKLIQALIAVSAVYVFIIYFYRYCRGWFHYFWVYASAALGYDLLVGPCGRLMQEVYPWRHLETAEWWEWNKCLGNDHGFARQGNIVPALDDIFLWSSDPDNLYSSWVVSASKSLDIRESY